MNGTPTEYLLGALVIAALVAAILLTGTTACPTDQVATRNGCASVSAER